MKNTLFRRSMVLCLSFLMFFSLNISVFAVGSTTPSSGKITVDEILRDYHSQLFLAEINKDQDSGKRLLTTHKEIKSQTLKRLTDAGYEAYDVNKDTFTAVENTLNTDLKSMGLNPNYSYIIVVSGSADDSNINNTNTRYGIVTNQETYTYGGVTYNLRYLKVTAADDPRFAKADPVDLLTSSDQQLIYNCLNAAVGTIISEISSVYGILLSLSGLSIEDFLPDRRAILELQCGTNWTLIYTQVWCKYTNDWVNGSCVEYANASCSLTGKYYNANSNSYKDIPSVEHTRTQYSDKAFNPNWKRQMAVSGYLGNCIYYNVAGDVKYTHDGDVVLIHRENF